MNKFISLAVALALFGALLAPTTGAQQQQQQQQQRPVLPSPSSQTQQSATPPAAPQDDEDDVVRITTNLVQVDAVVVDKKGQQVTDLRAEDFEIFEDRRAQKLTNFSYILNETIPRPAAATAAAAARRAADKNAAPEPPRRLRPEQVRRTMALVVDDIGLSFESTSFVRDALRKFVSEQMQPNDLVAIIRTSAGVGALQGFTSDKRQLNAAIDRIKWYVNGRGVGSFAALDRGATNPMGVGGGGADDIAGRTDGSDPTAELEDFREEIFAVGSLGALNFVVRGMRDLPGRKSVVLFSEGFALFSPDRGSGRGRSNRVYQSMQQLTDLANRASVVIYSIDPRGLVYTGLTAADDTSDLSNDEIDSLVRGRNERLFDTQSGLNYLSQQTGGFLIKNNNDLPAGIRRVVEDQKGYYLLGYRPESATFDRRFHRISVRVKRPGLKVRTRTGFYGIRDEETRPLRRTREQQLLAALTSPFASPDVHLRLTTVFGNTVEEGSFMRSLMHIDARDLKFSKEPDGRYKAVLDVVGVTFGDNGRAIDTRDRIQTLTLPEELYRQVLREGMTYNLTVPIKKAGAYQLRMAVRDASTERTGSASQFIEVPDLKKNRLALSGLILRGVRSEEVKKVGTNAAAATASATSAPEGNDQLAEGASAEQQTLDSPAVRRFRQNAHLDFGYAIYSARLDKATNHPQLNTRTRIFRDGQLVYEGTDQPLNATQHPDLKRISIITRLRLGSNLAPGEYVLQIVVTDLIAKPKDKHRVATQWTDFEIVK